MNKLVMRIFDFEFLWIVVFYYCDYFLCGDKESLKGSRYIHNEYIAEINQINIIWFYDGRRHYFRKQIFCSQ